MSTITNILHRKNGINKAIFLTSPKKIRSYVILVFFLLFKNSSEEKLFKNLSEIILIFDRLLIQNRGITVTAGNMIHLPSF